MLCVRDGSGKPAAMRNAMKHSEDLERTARPLRSLGNALKFHTIIINISKAASLRKQPYFSVTQDWQVLPSYHILARTLSARHILSPSFTLNAL
jgi:hypothetical protein